MTPSDIGGVLNQKVPRHRHFSTAAFAILFGAFTWTAFVIQRQSDAATKDRAAISELAAANSVLIRQLADGVCVSRQMAANDTADILDTIVDRLPHQDDPLLVSIREAIDASRRAVTCTQQP